MLAGSKLADALKVGLGKRAEKKAEALAPMLYNMAPAENLLNIQDLLAKAGAFQQFVNQTTPKRIGHLFGAAMGSTAANGYTTVGMNTGCRGRVMLVQPRRQTENNEQS
ncbi:hypothetical protein AB5I41_01410 [Sphingomonas sp. MMS24-JH45]